MSIVSGDEGDNHLSSPFSIGPISDSAYGFGGNDWLIGGTGEDALYGGPGNDTYYLAWDIFRPASFEDSDHNDHVIELPNEGNDTVQVRGFYGGYTLPDNVEQLLFDPNYDFISIDTLLGYVGVGNDLDNTIKVLSVPPGGQANSQHPPPIRSTAWAAMIPRGQ
jgi:Ca2+-binding RTX toxin-like protein